MNGLCYKDFPELYDLLYQRYFRTVPVFVKLVRREVKSKGRILDLAAGTGAVTIPLLKEGYDVTSADLNPGMLKVLERKAKKEKLKAKTEEKSFLEIDYKNKFDAVVVRQAINYLMSKKDMLDTFDLIYASLKADGKFIFNAPNNVQKYQKPIYNIYEIKGKNGFVLETNSLKKNILIHNQYSIIWSNTIRPFYAEDQNAFRIYSKDEFEDILSLAGFKSRFMSSELKEYDRKDKTIYVVAEK